MLKTLKSKLKDLKFQPPKWEPQVLSTKYEHRLIIEFPTHEPIYARVSSEPKAKIVKKALELLTINKPTVTYEKKKLTEMDEEGWML